MARYAIGFPWKPAAPSIPGLPRRPWSEKQREEGFVFVACPDDYWYDKEDFVLIFQRPKEMKEPGRDPEPLPPCSVEENQQFFLSLGRPYQRPVFVALGEARNMMRPF